MLLMDEESLSHKEILEMVEVGLENLEIQKNLKERGE